MKKIKNIAKRNISNFVEFSCRHYLGALDKQVKKEHENPSIGIIMCRAKDENIVEISLNRSTSPTVISQYETKLINKELLKNKLKELFSPDDE